MVDGSRSNIPENIFALNYPVFPNVHGRLNPLHLPNVGTSMESIKKFYYIIKPFLPRYLQVLIRRRYSKAMRLLYPEWPIMKNSPIMPEGWTGWPEGKKFAFISTHDVETEVGQGRCLPLMDLEKKRGFVSSFNFVPERYKVSAGIRNEIVRNGYEVGVHDLKHDGKLYDSREKFFQSAEKINEYLKSWNSVGFRSGSMHRNLEWLCKLDIEYDCSTFDFDPFEPQSNGVNTIYPFWVQDNGAGRGYLELPYTLPQDFSLFVLLKEKGIDLWKKKLDWVASHGGMVLLNTHPDYMNFDGKKNRFDEYPIRFYKELLQYVKTRYPGQYWNVLPCEVARNLCRGISPMKPDHRPTPFMNVPAPSKRVAAPGPPGHSPGDSDDQIPA
jgi:hypothetical protein